MDSEIKEAATGLMIKIRYRIHFAGRRRIFSIRRDFAVEKQAVGAETLIDFRCHFL
jgi:hypothetical protein